MRAIAASLAVLATLTLAKDVDEPFYQNNLTWTDGAIRMNHMQVVGTHNSYHIEGTPREYREGQELSRYTVPRYLNSHPKLEIQLSDQGVRSFEFDLVPDPFGKLFMKFDTNPGSGVATTEKQMMAHSEGRSTKVTHDPDIPYRARFRSIGHYLNRVRDWVRVHPEAVPIPILLQFQYPSRAAVFDFEHWDNEDLLEGLDEEIRSVFGPEEMIVPDYIRRGELSLEETILKHGWPDLDSARGKVFFLMENGHKSDVRKVYKENRPNLEGRIIFTNANPGDDDCAFQRINDPRDGKGLKDIQEQVRLGYFVRTRADTGPENIRYDCDRERGWDAFDSGAQIVSTDFQEFGMSSRWGCDYVVRLAGRRAARCNPVNSGEVCEDTEEGLEPGEYRFLTHNIV